MSSKSSRITEDRIAQIVELALKQRLSPVFFDLLMSRIHTLNSSEADSIVNTLQKLECAEDEYIERGRAWIAFWRELEQRLDDRLNQERAAVEEELFTRLTRGLSPFKTSA